MVGITAQIGAPIFRETIHEVATQSAFGAFAVLAGWAFDIVEQRQDGRTRDVGLIDAAVIGTRGARKAFSIY